MRSARCRCPARQAQRQPARRLRRSGAKAPPKRPAPRWTDPPAPRSGPAWAQRPLGYPNSWRSAGFVPSAYGRGTQAFLACQTQLVRPTLCRLLHLALKSRRWLRTDRRLTKSGPWLRGCGSPPRAPARIQAAGQSFSFGAKAAVFLSLLGVGRAAQGTPALFWQAFGCAPAAQAPAQGPGAPAAARQAAADSSDGRGSFCAPEDRRWQQTDRPPAHR